MAQVGLSHTLLVCRAREMKLLCDCGKKSQVSEVHVNLLWLFQLNCSAITSLTDYAAYPRNSKARCACNNLRASRWRNHMTLPRIQFLHLAAGAAALPA